MAGAYRTADSTAPAHGAVSVTPSDATELPVTRGLYVGVAGNLRVKMTDGQTVTLVAAANGYHPLQVIQVLSTSTTATDIVALY